MPVIKNFSTENPEKVKELLGYVKLPFDKKHLKKVSLHGKNYPIECVGVKLKEVKE